MFIGQEPKLIKYILVFADFEAADRFPKVQVEVVLRR